MMTFVVEVARHKNLRCLYSYFYFRFEQKKTNSLKFFIIIWQVYGKLDLASVSWSVEITEHKEVVKFLKIALLNQTCLLVRKSRILYVNVAFLILYDVRLSLYVNNWESDCFILIIWIRHIILLFATIWLANRTVYCEWMIVNQSYCSNHRQSHCACAY